MGDQIYVESLSRKDREKLLKKIIHFCKTPKTYKEVGNEFDLSGISASAVLKSMAQNNQLDYEENGKYTAKHLKANS